MNKRLSYDQEEVSAITFLEQEDIFTALVHDHSSRLTCIAYGITKNWLVSEDIVQEAFLKLWQKRAEIIPDNLGGWLYKVVANLAYKHQKRESRQQQIVSSLSATKKGFCTDVEEQLMNKENDQLFHHILNLLPEKQRQVYRLSREEGLGRNEIALQLNVSPNTVKEHLSRALRFVKEHVVSLSLFILFFIFNNIFFKKSSTVPAPGDLYKVKQVIEKKSSGNSIAWLRPVIPFQL